MQIIHVAVFKTGLKFNSTVLLLRPFLLAAARQKISVSPYITPQWTPGATPKVISTGVSPRGYSAAASPKIVSKSSSPTKHHSESRATLTSWYPPSAKSSAPSSPPRGRPVSGCLSLRSWLYQIGWHLSLSICLCLLFKQVYMVTNINTHTSNLMLHVNSGRPPKIDGKEFFRQAR